MKTVMICLTFVICLALTVPAQAGKKPSASTCKELGMLDISCYDCKSHKFLGKVSVQAQYNLEDKGCMGRYKEARSRCATAYGHPKRETWIKWDYWMSITKYNGNYPVNCK